MVREKQVDPSRQKSDYSTEILKAKKATLKGKKTVPEHPSYYLKASKSLEILADLVT